MSAKCLDFYLSESDWLNVECGRQIVAKVVSYLIMTVSLFVKVPQVIKVFNARSGDGLSYVSLFIETTAFTAHFSYCLVSNYPFSIYGDAIVTYLQTLLILCMKLHFEGRKTASIFTFSTSIAFAIFVSSGFLSMQTMTYFNRFGFSIMLFGGISQIITNFKNKSTGQISVVSMYMAFTICVIRVLIVLQESNDKGLAVGAGLASFLIGILILQIKWYEKKPESSDKKSK